MTDNIEDKEYEVGYGRPPKEYQFKPGQSGHSKGRPKKPRTFQEAFNKILAEEIYIVENGKKRRTTMLEALVRKLIQSSLHNDKMAIPIVMKEYGKNVRLPEIVEETSEPSVYDNIDQGCLSDKEFEAEKNHIRLALSEIIQNSIQEAAERKQLEEWNPKPSETT
jgi:hypothetical protein